MTPDEKITALAPLLQRVRKDVTAVNARKSNAFAPDQLELF